MYVISCGFKNKYRSDTCSKERDLCALDIVAILGSIVNNNLVRFIWPYIDTKTFVMIMNKIFVSAPKITRKVDATLIWVC